MKKIVFSALYFFVIAECLKAQKPEILLEKWTTAHPVEKVWLHFDRDEYIAGETAWFKAYLASDNLPDTISTTLYVQLINNDMTIVTKAVLPVLIAGSNGQLDLPDTLTTGMYTIRAFTPNMMNSPDFIFKKGVYVYGKSRKPEPVTQNKVHIRFFPEGGNLVAGFNNTVAFKVYDDYGFPVTVSGSIKNSKGVVMVSFSPSHDGMGLFELSPVAGEKYYAVADNLPGEKFLLPDVVQNGITLTMLLHPQGYYFEIQQRPTDQMFTAAYIIGQMQNRPVFKLDFSGQAKESQQGIINTLQLHSGIMQVTVFNKDGMPLAERLCFINNKEYIQPVTFLGDTVSFKERGRNRFSFLLSDTVEANMSVSVTDAAYEQYSVRRENIFTCMLLTSDIKGYVHNPAYYFSANTDSVKAAVDLVMMTNGWRRFAWKDLAGMSASVTKPPAYITLSGRATLRGTNRPFDSKSLLLLINGMGLKKKRSSYLLQTDTDGKFVLDSLVFYGRNRLLFSDIRGKKSQYTDIVLSGDSLHKIYPVKDFSPVTDSKSTLFILSKWKDDYAAILKANGSMLEEVTVKAQRKSPMEILDDKYTTGMFSGDAVKAIDLVSSDEADPYNNIFDYLQARVNGLTVTNDADGGYGLFYRQGPSISSMGNIPMTIFLDEIETDAAVVATIPGNQVAFVKIYQTFAGSWGNAPGGAISIYTKKGEDYRSGTSYANFSIYNGYSVIKEFYAPDYKTPGSADDKPDNRITLDWRPNVIVNSINPKIPLSFYNNDRTKMFKVVLEGMTSSGKLIWLEKVIKP